MLADQIRDDQATWLSGALKCRHTRASFASVLGGCFGALADVRRRFPLFVALHEDECTAACPGSCDASHAGACTDACPMSCADRRVRGQRQRALPVVSSSVCV